MSGPVNMDRRGTLSTVVASLQVGNAMLLLWPWMRAKLVAMYSSLYLGMLYNISRLELLLTDLVMNSFVWPPHSSSSSPPSSPCYDHVVDVMSSFVKSQRCAHICFNVLLIVVLMKSGFFGSIVKKKREDQNDDYNGTGSLQVANKQQVKRNYRSRRSRSSDSLPGLAGSSSPSYSAGVISGHMKTGPLTKDTSRIDYKRWGQHINSRIRVAHTEATDEEDKFEAGSKDEFHRRVEDFIVNFRRRIWVESNSDRNLTTYGPSTNYLPAKAQSKALLFQAARASVS